jgi:hypothetical protein
MSEESKKFCIDCEHSNIGKGKALCSTNCDVTENIDYIMGTIDTKIKYDNCYDKNLNGECNDFKEFKCCESPELFPYTYTQHPIHWCCKQCGFNIILGNIKNTRYINKFREK